MSYATLAQLKAYLRIPTANTANDQLLTDTLTRVTGFIDSYTKRRFGATNASTDYTVTDEVHDGVQQNIIYLYNMDVRSITSLKIGNTQSGYTVLDPTNYIWKTNGRIVLGGPTNFNRYNSNIFQGLAFGYQTLLISYVYGVMGVPPEIEQACLDISSTIYTLSANNGLKSEKVGEYAVVYNTLQEQALQTNPDALGTLKALRKLSV